MKNTLHSNIGDVCERLHQGLNTAGEKIRFYDSGYPIIQTRNIESGAVELDNKIKLMCEEDWLFYKNKYKPEIGDVFFTNIGTIGKTAVITVERDYLIHWNIFKLKPNPEKITSAYLRYVLENLTITGYFNKLQKGGTVDFVTKKMISEAKILLPLLNEQKRIAAILDQAFESIAKARANAVQNLQNARALFESHLQSVFTQRGEGWGWQTLAEVCEEVFAGGDVPKDNHSKTITDKYQIPIFTNGEKNKGLYGYTDKARVTVPSITISARGTIGYSEIRNENYYPAIRLIVVIPKKEILDLSFLYYAIISMDIGYSGTSIPQLTVPMVKDFSIPIPSLGVQQTIATQFDELQTETQRLEALYQRKIDCLDELKKSLLQQAFAGEL